MTRAMAIAVAMVMAQAGDADQEENQYFGHEIGPRSRIEMPLIPRDAEFRGGSFYDGFEAIRGEFRA